MITQDYSAQFEKIFRGLNKIQQQQQELKESVNNLTAMRDTLVRGITLDSFTLEGILNVSESTLYRWRNMGMLPYHVRENGSIYYDFDELLQRARKGDLNGRGFRRGEVIEKLVRYRDEILYTQGRGSWFNKIN